MNNAVHQGLIDEATLDVALRRLFTTRMKLGMFDPDENVPYAQIPLEVNDSPLHQRVALEIARESMVLLKNDNQILPLDKELKSIAVIGPHADWDEVLWGNYNGTPSRTVTPLEGIRSAVSLATKVTYARGCGVTSRDQSDFDEAVELALKADVVVMVLGLSQAVEGEENQEEGVEEGEKSTGDRVGIDLPGVQLELLKAIHAVGVPIVLVLINGSAISINWADEHVDAILEAWYPGQAGGTAIADVLFGDYNPAGRLPVTFYKSVDQLPPFRNYNMAGRTYLYMTEQPLYPFVHGLSYTQFEYSDLEITPEQVGADDIVDIYVDVTNVGTLAGDEVVQLYIRDPESSVARPRQELKGFARIPLQPGQSQTVHFQLAARQLSFFENGSHWLEPGKIEVLIGASSADIRLRGQFEIVGDKTDVSAERVFFMDVLLE